MSDKILQFLYSFKTVAVPEFVVAEKFVEGKTIDGVPIVWLGPNFKKYLLHRVEKNVKPAKLKVHELLVSARTLPEADEPGIIFQFGGKYETMLAHLHQLLVYNKLRGDFSTIVAYISCEDDAGNVMLWAVNAYCDSDGLRVEAISLDHRIDWDAGHRFLSL